MQKILLLLIAIIYSTTLFSQQAKVESVSVSQKMGDKQSVMNIFTQISDNMLTVKSLNSKKNSWGHITGKRVIKESYALANADLEKVLREFTEIISGNEFVKKITRKQYDKYLENMNNDKKLKSTNTIVLKRGEEYLLIQCKILSFKETTSMTEEELNRHYKHEEIITYIIGELNEIKMNKHRLNDIRL